MSARRYIVIGSTLGVFALTLVGCSYLSGDVASTQLLGIGFAYEDAVLREFDQQRNMNAPFCGGGQIESELKHADVQCGPPALPRTSDCNPIASSISVPPYVMPYDDEFFVDLALTDHTTDEVLAALSSITREKMLEDGTSRDSPYFNLIGGTRTVSARQCEGYALVRIAQHYYRQFYPWSLFYPTEP
jgi:hypothetical protein